MGATARTSQICRAASPAENRSRKPNYRSRRRSRCTSTRFVATTKSYRNRLPLQPWFARDEPAVAASWSRALARASPQLCRLAPVRIHAYGSSGTETVLGGAEWPADSDPRVRAGGTLRVLPGSPAAVAWSDARGSVEVHAASCHSHWSVSGLVRAHGHWSILLFLYLRAAPPAKWMFFSSRGFCDRSSRRPPVRQFGMDQWP